MHWKNKELISYANILDAVLACENKTEAEEFMKLYSAENKHAAKNVGYLAGYCSHEDATRIYDWFSCEHPIFGTKFPTTEEALLAGFKLGSQKKASMNEVLNIPSFISLT